MYADLFPIERRKESRQRRDDSHDGEADEEKG